MSHPNKFGLIVIIVLVLATLTCNLGPVTISMNSPSATPTPAATGAASFGAITFAEEVEVLSFYVCFVGCSATSQICLLTRE